MKLQNNNKEKLLSPGSFSDLEIRLFFCQKTSLHKSDSKNKTNHEVEQQTTCDLS